MFFLNLRECGQFEVYKYTTLYLSYPSLKDELDNNDNINIEKSIRTVRSIEMKFISLSLLSNSKEKILF